MGWNTRPQYAAALLTIPVLPAIGVVAVGYAVQLPAPLFPFQPAPAPLASVLGAMTLGTTALGASTPDQRAGAFIRDPGLVAGTLGELLQGQYLPVNIPDSTVGTFVVGESAIDHPSPALHGQIEG